MHLYLITRGIKNDVDQFITELQGKYLPFKWYDPNQKKLVDTMVQVAVRPIQLWEIVYPKESNDLVLNTIFKGRNGETNHKRHKKFVYGARKILGVKPIPKYDQSKSMPITCKNMELIGVGVKEDYTTPEGMEGL